MSFIRGSKDSFMSETTCRLSPEANRDASIDDVDAQKKLQLRIGLCKSSMEEESFALKENSQINFF